MSEDLKGRILVVDDDENAIEILTRMLNREGHVSIAASNGPEALETLGRETVDVILLDVMMPGMDGLEVCQRLREDERLRQIPVILLTAKDDMETRSRAMALGVSEFLTKPVNRRELFTRVAAQLHARNLSRELAKTAQKVSGSANESGGD
ncbi:MAG: response regulator [Candidatus Binatia bacterium]|nr:response regulator [Candidatus Binatia bacterium]